MTIRASFAEVFGNDLDEDTLDYCVSLLDEDSTLHESVESLCLAIGDFLDLDESVSQEKCSALFKLIQANPGSVTVQKSLAPQLLEGPITVDKLIDESVFEDRYMGLEAVKTNTNETMEAGTLKDQVKKRNLEQKEREALLRRIEAWENQKKPAPVPTCRHRNLKDGGFSKVTDIIVDSFSVAVAGRPLLEDSPLRIVIGRRYAIIGRNGIGKTVFLSALARGEITGINPDIHVACVEQDIDHLTRDKTRGVMDVVLDVDVERRQLMAEVAKLQAKLALPPVALKGGKGSAADVAAAGAAAAAASLVKVYARLADIDSDGAFARAAMILHGLGVSEQMQKQPLASLSGGWRMRVVLARALFSNPDLLLLDEPTNHLDVHAVAWLSDYLTTSAKTFILVSHARDFINEVCTDIIYFDHLKKQLDFYRGDYDSFETVRATKSKLMEKQLEAQQNEREHIQKFVDRFRFNANRAALVQSRIKALQRLPMLEEIAKDPTLVFEFKEPEQLPAPILKLDKVEYIYAATNTVAAGSRVNSQQPAPTAFKITCDGFSVDLDSRIALCGENGSGKTTFIKVLVDELGSGHMEGHVLRNNRLRIGYFSQHHVDTLDVTKSAVAALISKYDKANIGSEVARNYLGQFGITGQMALEPLYCLSGGQRSRVALAIIAYANPHILIMDEPTNHLDMDAVQALIVSLSNFKGGVLIVSHDFHTLKCVCDEVWHSEAGVVSKFNGDIDDFKKYIRKKRVVSNK